MRAYRFPSIERAEYVAHVLRDHCIMARTDGALVITLANPALMANSFHVRPTVTAASIAADHADAITEDAHWTAAQQMGKLMQQVCTRTVDVSLTALRARQADHADAIREDAERTLCALCRQAPKRNGDSVLCVECRDWYDTQMPALRELHHADAIREDAERNNSAYMNYCAKYGAV